MLNISTKTINPTASYRVTMTDDVFGDTKTKTMTGADLKELAYAVGHLYDMTADIIETTETAETTGTAEQTEQGAERDDRIAETAQDIETAHSIIKAMIKDIISQSARSAWARGVRNYALMLARNLREREKDAQRNGEPSTLRSREVVRAALLNGAEDWTQYSYGGCAYIYDEDIALHTCTASEYRRKRGGKLQPNPAETWLDVQARALYQASVKVLRAYDLALDAIREGARA